MFGRSSVIDHSKFRLLAALDDAVQRPAHDPQRISKQRAVGWMLNVSFHGGGIGAQLFSGHDGRLLALLHDPLVDLLSSFLTKERKSPTQIAKIWNRVLIKAREAPV